MRPDRPRALPSAAWAPAPGRGAAVGTGVGVGDKPPPPMTASDWRPVVSNTLRGFFSLCLPPWDIAVPEFSLHQNGDRRWVGMPGRAQIDANGQHRIDPQTGKRAYTPVLVIRDREKRERFQRAALAAVDQLLEGGP